MGLVIYSSIFYHVSDIFSYSSDRYCKIQLFRILSFGYQGSRSEFCRHEKLHQSFEIRYVPVWKKHIDPVAVALVLASWFTDLRMKIHGKQFFKVVIYLPNLIMASAFALLFFTMFSTNGPVNSILLSLGVLKAPIDFLGSVLGTRGLIGFMNFMMWFGNTTIMLMAAVMGVSVEVYEAADLDGCNGIQRFFYITLPMIRPILAYTLITSIIGGLQMFDVPQILTNGQGNPDRTSMTLIMFLNSHLKSKNYGMAGSLSVYLFIVSGILCFFVYRMTNDNDPDGSKKAAKKRAKEERRRARS